MTCLIVTGKAALQSDDTVWVWVRSTDLAIAEQIMNQMASAGEPSGVTLQVVDSADEIPAQAPAVEVQIATAPHNLTFINTQLLHSQIQLPSPDLYTTIELPVSTLSQEEQLTTDSLVLLALYSVGACESVVEMGNGAITSQLSYFVGNCHLALGAYEDAIVAFERSDVYATGVTFNLAWAYLQIGRADEGIDLLTDAISQPNSEAFPTYTIQQLSHRAQIYALDFQFDPAIEDITTAIAMAETFGAPPEITAKLYKQRGDHIFLIYEWDRVLQDYNQAIELDSDYADAYYARGVLYYTQGPRTAALQDFEMFSTLAPDSPRIAEAQTYIESIKVELEALGGDDTGSFAPGD